MDALVGQLAQISLRVKTTNSSNIDSILSFRRVCYFFNNLVNSVENCNHSTHKDHKCERSGNIGHNLATLWSHLKGSDSRFSFQDVRSENVAESRRSTDPSNVGEPVGVVTDKNDITVAAKRATDEESLLERAGDA